MGFKLSDYRGKVVILEHSDGYRTVYAHLHRIKVEVGDTLVRRVPLGLTGNTGRSRGAHLHFEIRTADNRRLDPAPYLGLAYTKIASAKH